MHSIFSYNCSAKKEKTLTQATSKKIKQEKKRKLEIIVRKERKNDEEEELKIIMLGF